MRKLPNIGCGTWTYDDDSARENVLKAIEVGYTLIDTAERYNNEKGVGQAIRNSGVSRDDILICSKVWKDHYKSKDVRDACCRSLEKLQLDYLDVYLIHWPQAEKDGVDWKERNAITWEAMERLKADGLVREIGVSNFSVKYLEELLKTTNTIPFVNQIEFHPGYIQSEIVNYCIKKGIYIEAWSPFGRGEAFENETIQQIATEKGYSMGQIILKWISEHGIIPIIKSTHKERLIENKDYLKVILNQEDVSKIDSIEFFGKLGLNPDTAF